MKRPTFACKCGALGEAEAPHRGGAKTTTSEIRWQAPKAPSQPSDRTRSGRWNRPSSSKKMGPPEGRKSPSLYEGGEESPEGGFRPDRVEGGALYSESRRLSDPPSAGKSPGSYAPEAIAAVRGGVESEAKPQTPPRARRSAREAEPPSPPPAEGRRRR